MLTTSRKAALRAAFANTVDHFRVLALAAGMASTVLAAPALADDAAAEETYRDIEATLGGVPSFVRAYPKAAVPGAWAQVKAMEFSGPTALDSKVKALISLAVGAQVPCHYCVWLDTRTARSFGATDEEISEAVTMAAIARHWSTVFHGQQLDFDQFRREFGDE
jgi:AhpD family alkylhydroperoxidase